MSAIRFNRPRELRHQDAAVGQTDPKQIWLLEYPSNTDQRFVQLFRWDLQKTFSYHAITRSNLIWRNSLAQLKLATPKASLDIATVTSAANRPIMNIFWARIRTYFFPFVICSTSQWPTKLLKTTQNEVYSCRHAYYFQFISPAFRSSSVFVFPWAISPKSPMFRTNLIRRQFIRTDVAFLVYYLANRCLLSFLFSRWHHLSEHNPPTIIPPSSFHQHINGQIQCTSPLAPWQQHQGKPQNVFPRWYELHCEWSHDGRLARKYRHSPASVAATRTRLENSRWHWHWYSDFLWSKVFQCTYIAWDVHVGIGNEPNSPGGLIHRTLMLLHLNGFNVLSASIIMDINWVRRSSILQGHPSQLFRCRPLTRVSTHTKRVILWEFRWHSVLKLHLNNR